MFANSMLISAFSLAVSFLFSVRLLFDGPERLRRAFFVCRFMQYFGVFSLVSVFPWDGGSFPRWRLLMMAVEAIVLVIMGLWSKRLDALAQAQEKLLGPVGLMRE